MPETYAHYAFGREVLKKVDFSLKEIILRNIDLYNIGLHGPDIFFYYKPFSKNKISDLGHEQHSQISSFFFNKARNTINQSENKEAAISYISGFICHFMLDSKCHPYINRLVNNLVSHSDVETEFDRALMSIDNLEAFSFKPIKHITVKEEYTKIISLFYEDVDSGNIFESLNTMKFILSMLVDLRHTKWILKKTNYKQNKDLSYKLGLVMSKQPIKDCILSTEKLIEMYHEEIEPAAFIINEYFENLSSNLELNVRFNQRFG